MSSQYQPKNSHLLQLKEGYYVVEIDEKRTLMKVEFILNRPQFMTIDMAYKTITPLQLLNDIHVYSDIKIIDRLPDDYVFDVGVIELTVRSGDRLVINDFSNSLQLLKQKLDQFPMLGGPIGYDPDRRKNRKRK